MQERIWHITESRQPYANTLITHWTSQCCSASSIIKGIPLHGAGRGNVKAEHKATPSCSQQMLWAAPGFEQSRRCFTVHSRDFAFSLQTCYHSALAPFQYHCLPRTVKTRELTLSSLRPGLSIWWPGAAPSFQQYTMVLTSTSAKQSPAAGGILTLGIPCQGRCYLYSGALDQ